MSVIPYVGLLLVAVAAWPLLYGLARVWGEHPEYPYAVKPAREAVFSLLFAAPALALLAVGALLLGSPALWLAGVATGAAVALLGR